MMKRTYMKGIILVNKPHPIVTGKRSKIWFWLGHGSEIIGLNRMDTNEQISHIMIPAICLS